MSSAKIYWRNRVRSSQASVFPSSEEASFTREALQRAGLTDRLRFKVGWDVIANVNDDISFIMGGTFHALLTPGNYPTAVEMADMVETAMTTAVANAWAVSQDPVSGLWTFSGTTAFTLLDSNFTSERRSGLGDLGFPNVDTTSDTTHTSPLAAFMSRKWITLDAGDAQDPFWTITELNDALDFNRAGVKLALITRGIYTSGSSMALAVYNALVAADPGVTWSVVYYTDILRFAISCSASFDLLTNTGANAATAIWDDLGYNTGSDHTGFTLYTGEQSTAGSPRKSFDLALVRGHNLGDASTARVDAHSVSLDALGLDYDALTFQEDLVADPDARTDLRRVDFTPARGERYWRLVLDARSSSAAIDSITWVELGVWGLMQTLQLTSLAPGVEDSLLTQTSIVFAVEGMHGAVQRESRPKISVTVQNMLDVDKRALKAFSKEVKPSGAFFFSLDPDDDPYDLEYVFFEQDFAFVKEPETNGVNVRLWHSAFTMLGVLG
jgi:hypothetical protein